MFKRSENNPILKPDPKLSWESKKVYNPGIYYYNYRYYLYYRALGDTWQSVIGLAISTDGVNFTRRKEPVLKIEHDFEKAGLEDPRISRLGDTFFMTYAAYDGKSPVLQIATSEDLVTWKKRGKALGNFNFDDFGGKFIYYKDGRAKTKKNVGEWSKSGAIFPEKIKGRYWMLFGEYKIWIATSEDGLGWTAEKEPFLEAREKPYFDNNFVEMGPTPILTDKGWLVLYHGVDKELYYRLGYLLLDKNDPAKLIERSEKAIFWPEEKYELSGIVDILPGGIRAMKKMSGKELQAFIESHEQAGTMPKVAFVCGAILDNNLLRIYYGASDTYVCTATADLKDIL